MTQYITTAGYKVLKNEFEYLKFVERPKIVQEVADAAAQGDRSENAEYIYGKKRMPAVYFAHAFFAEYIYGKKRMREIDSRLRFLSRNFEDMQVIDPATPRGDKIFFGATVKLYDEDADTATTYQLVGPLDNLDDTHISYNSPVGQALLGHALDDEITIKTPTATRHFTVMDVRYI